jgi:hypothetical protein
VDAKRLPPCGAASKAADVVNSYPLKSILHDWDDPEAVRVLCNCRQAMKPNARLLIIERMLAPPASSSMQSSPCELHAS